MAQGHKGATVTLRLWVQSPLDEINYYFLIFSFLALALRQGPAVEIRHLTRNVSKNRQKVEMECPNTKFPRITLVYAEYSVKLIVYLDLN